jgi:mono/diheme cytochrome c family protein
MLSRPAVGLILVTAFSCCVGLLAVPASAQSRPAQGLTDGAQLFAAGCAGCHGPDGSGAPDSTVGFEKPSTYPDFSACNQTSPEVEADWRAVIHDGGKARGFSHIMPAFGELLTPDQITSLVTYIRGLCQDRAWASGELNFPRALLTEKAFPESEWVLDSSVGTKAAHDSLTTVFYERRIGARDQIEIAIPFAVAHEPSGGAEQGLGDMGFGLKHVLFSNRATIFSVQGEVTAPTGDVDRGLGGGVTVFEGFAAFGHSLGRGSFVQAQAGGELPADTSKAPKAVFGRMALGKTFRQDYGIGRMWTPMLELAADRDLESGASTNVDIVPEMQVTLNRRQHVRLGAGLQIPLNQRDERSNQFRIYVLWDWFDGGLFDGWK